MLEKYIWCDKICGYVPLTFACNVEVGSFFQYLFIAFITYFQGSPAKSVLMPHCYELWIIPKRQAY